MVAGAAHEMRAILVTYNEKHFRHLISLTPSKVGEVYFRAGLITFFKCRQTVAGDKLQESLPLIEFEYRRQLRLDRPRLIAKISERWIQFEQWPRS